LEEMASTQSTPTQEQPDFNDDANNARRKRTTTAERRATHNAVERARRETLNGRFLLLASLLPNLSQIRRPSKSAIVNSSIAHVNASKRHRLLAARITQELLRESEELRREVNEWRDRAGVRKVEPRMRSEGMGMVLRGELEAISISPEDEDEEDYQYHEQLARSGPPHMASHYVAPRPPVLQRHSTYGPAMHHPIIVSPTAPVHFDPAHPANTHGMGYAPSHQHMVAAPHTAMPSPPAAPSIHSPHPSHHSSPFAHSAEPYMHHDTEKAYNISYATGHTHQSAGLVPQQWSDDSSSASSGSIEHGQSRPASGSFHSPPSSPSSFEPTSSGSRSSFEFGSYEFEGAYDLVPPGSSESGSSDGFMGSIPRGLSGQTMLSGPPAGMSADHFGMLGVA
jgi:hypothetical protein